MNLIPNIPVPNNPRMVYLPTLTIKLSQMSVNIPNMDVGVKPSENVLFFLKIFLSTHEKKVLARFCVPEKKTGRKMYRVSKKKENFEPQDSPC